MTAYAAVLLVMNRLNEALRCNPIEVGDCASEYLVFVSHYNKSEFPQDRDTLESVFLAANQDDFLANNSFLEHDKVTRLWMCLSNFLYHQTKLEDFKRIQNFMRSDVEAFLKAPPLLSGNDGMHITKYANDIEALFEWFISNNKTIPHSLFYRIEKGFLCLKRSGIMQSECATTCTNDFAVCNSSCSSSLHIENNIVGFDDDLIKLKEHLIGFPHRLSIISVVGMGGIGKSTLTRAVYDDPSIEHYFYTRSWIVVSQEYEVRKMLIGILDCVANSTEEIYQMSNEQLAEQLYRSLKGRRYLVVLDDIWDIEAWNDIRRSFPDDNNGSRIIFTSRQTYIANHVNARSLTHGMHLLNIDQSSKLLSLRVFGADSFPLDLENVGNQIVGKCQGLPLAVIVVAGILVKINKTPESWEDVAKSLGLFEINGNSEECLDVLALSYKYLPHHLKPCFLYIGAFPKNDEISVRKIIRLLVAEGFLWEIEGETMEEVAEYYLEDLISRNLLIATKRGYDGRVIKCSMHNLLRDMSVRESQREEFLYVSVSRAVPHSVSRYFFHSDIDWNCYHDLSEFLSRSFLAFGRVQLLINQFMWLRVLDISFQPFIHFPNEICSLKFLRYLALASFDDLPSSVSRLCHLQTLVRRCHEACLILPEEIWEMKQLRHLYFKKCSRLPVPGKRMTWYGEKHWDLPRLQTLSNLNFGSCAHEILTQVPNLKKLGLREDEGECLSDEQLVHYLNNLKLLHCLETLKCFFTKQRPLPMPDAFPPNLKQLTLQGCHRPWKEMWVLSALPKLEVLKLKDYAFKGSEWELTDEEVFFRLKVLLIDIVDLEQWEASSINFPKLQSLVLKYCTHLREIPIGFGEIYTLQSIELWECNSSTYDSVDRIREEQENSGNDGLIVRIHRGHNDE